MVVHRKLREARVMQAHDDGAVFVALIRKDGRNSLGIE